MEDVERIEKYIEFLEYVPDGSLVWTNLPRRKDRVGVIAGSENSRDGYVYVGLGGKRVLAHRIVFYMHFGYVPKQIDHINRIKNDNRIENLRACTSSQNLINRDKYPNKSSVYKGVHWDSARRKWGAYGNIGGKAKNLGRFNEEEQAAKEYDKFCIENFGVFSNLNFPKETK